MTTEILALALVISGLLIGLMGAGVVAAVIIAIVWKLFPNCWLTKWIKDEVFQEEDLTFKSEQQDWISERMNRREK